MSKQTKQPNNLIGRPAVLDFGCRWKLAAPQFQAQLRADYEKREDYGKTCEIVDYDQEELRARVLFQDGSTENLLHRRANDHGHGARS